jgi:hypothetical protein
MNRPYCVLASFLLCFAGLISLQAQEVVTPLQSNPRAALQFEKFRGAKKSARASLLELPFFDEFSNNSLQADTLRWTDAFAFINNNFCDNPLTNGVATLDALDEVGAIYSNAVLDPNSFEADVLSSRPINLSYPASDSIYFSFLYQPGGLCDLPEEQDSLMVDFYESDSSRWINVWRIPGTDMHPFKHVMIPVTDKRFLTDSFRFRFRNRASLPRNNEMPDKRSNVDYWHLDYVRLDRNRTAADTVLRDVAFNRALSSIFKELSAVPWSHFESAYNTTLAPEISAQYRNNDSITRNVTRSLTIEEPIYGESELIGSPTAQDIPAFSETVVDFAFPYDLDFYRGDSALIRFKVALRTDEFDPKVNDTLIHDQLFRDYYAYDDGTAEAGYGLRGDGTQYGMVAIRYYSYKADMLGGVYIYFNQVLDSLNLKEYSFNLMVWSDSDGNPGSIVWDDDRLYKPLYTPGYTGFVKYEFEEPVPVNGTFYVGWRQYKPFMLNMGLDRNRIPDSPVMYYNMGNWQSSEAPGTVLFRPYLFDTGTGTDQNGPLIAPLTIYPNPAGERIWLQVPPGAEGKAFPVYIFDTSGRQLYHSLLRSRELDISGLAPGLYYIRAIISGDSYFSKLLINR